MARLRALIDGGRVQHAPGVTDSVSAALLRLAGFQVGYLSGATVSAASLGLPDLGFVAARDVADHAARILPALRGIPLVADADTGYGNALHAARTVREYAAAGIAALHIEDQTFPKRCGHMTGKSVVPVEEAAGRIAAAVTAASDEVDIIARTDAYSVLGLDAAIERAVAFAEAGAHLLFVEGVTAAAELAAVHAAVDGVPLVLNRSEAGGDTAHGLGDDELRRLGVGLVIHPVAGLLASAAAVRDVYAAIGAAGHAGPVQRMPWNELNDVLGLPALLEAAESMA